MEYRKTALEVDPAELEVNPAEREARVTPVCKIPKIPRISVERAAVIIFDEGRKLEYRKTKTFIAYPPITIVAA